MGKDQISLFQMRFSFTFSVSETGMHYTQWHAFDVLAAFFPLMAQIMVHHRYQRHFRFDEMDRYLTGSREVRHPRQRDWHDVSTEAASLRAWRESLPARAGPAEHRSVPGLGTPHAATPGPAQQSRRCDKKPRPSTREEPLPAAQRRPKAVKAQLSQQK